MKNEISASVQYGDISGEISFDGFKGALLVEIAKQCGIDLENNFPLALKLRKGEFGNSSIDLFACNKSEYGENIDVIRKKALLNGEIEVKKFELSISVDELLKKIKRLEIFGKIAGVSDLKFVTTDEV